HPLVRMKVISSFATGFGWWWQKHPETGEPVLTYVHPATGIKALPDAEFFEADRTDQGRDYIASESFMDQMRNLELAVPFTATRSLIPTINSIALLSQGDENSYFVTACKSKNSFYSYSAVDTENSSEVYESSFVVNSYSVLNSHRIHNCKFVRQSFDCMNSAFLFDCRNCEFCFGATNKRNAKYVFFNEQLSKDEWEKRVSAIELTRNSTVQEYVKRFRDLVHYKAVWPENFNEHVENCVGEFLYKCRDCKYVFFGLDGPSHNYYGCCFFGQSQTNAFVGGAVDSTENFYSHAPLQSRGCKYVHSCVSCQNMEYCMQCWNCENCFACVGLVRKQFCIFNKQYLEQEYWEKVDELKCLLLEKEEYGEFFPWSFAPTYPLASVGLMYLIDEKDVEQLGGLLFDSDSAGALGETTGSGEPKSPEDIPNCINDIKTEEWTAVPIFDANEKRRFAFLKPEIELYKKLGIAASNIHPMTRLKNLVFEANSAIFIDHKCVQCQKEITISKNATYPDKKVYCKECYLQYLEKNR
ncbi:MAG: hypothetical protein ABIH21_02805, partial [Patescibacteria group bacterium]